MYVDKLKQMETNDVNKKKQGGKNMNEQNK